jgi:DNA-binding LacI/PurR family transcriptional regulator
VGPPLTAVQRNITGFGARAARLLLDAVERGGTPVGMAVQTEAGHLVVRRSTGPAAG